MIPKERQCPDSELHLRTIQIFSTVLVAQSLLVKRIVTIIFYVLLPNNIYNQIIFYCYNIISYLELRIINSS